jgi:hypothetical protein
MFRQMGSKDRLLTKYRNGVDLPSASENFTDERSEKKTKKRAATLPGRHMEFLADWAEAQNSGDWVRFLELSRRSPFFLFHLEEYVKRKHLLELDTVQLAELLSTLNSRGVFLK